MATATSQASSGRVAIREGALTVELVPSLGGSIASARYHGRDVLRPLSAEAERARDILGVACFPMVPYANRIDHNQFEFEGRVHRFAPNVPPEPYNEHGSGWTSAWSVNERSANRAVLQLERRNAAEPYSFRATQTFTVRNDRLDILTSVTNLGAMRMPFGFGQHPWFARDPDTTVRFEATHFWLEGPGGSATDRITLPPELDFASARALPARWRNNCYGGWRGVAELCFPSRRIAVKLTADPVFRHLMLYADPALPVFCLEPQTNASCAFNNLSGMAHQDLGVVVLDPGAHAEGSISLAMSGT